MGTDPLTDPVPLEAEADPENGAWDAGSAERFARRGDVEICYQTFGDPEDPALLLVMGLGGPMLWWTADLCRELAGRGFFVIRYDNRDTGRSSSIERPAARSAVVKSFLKLPASPAYTIVDLAEDGFAVLSDLGIDAAHVMGMSMGGFIVQTMAITRPDRVLSMVSVMSSTGSRRVGYQHPRIYPALLRPRGASREEYVAGSTAFWRLIESPAYPDTDAGLRERAEDTYDRGFDPAGVLRQMQAILAQEDRTEALRGVDCPTAVVHGLADRMVHVSGGRATARALGDAELVLIEGMGHDLPRALYSRLADVVRRTADRADGADQDSGPART